VSKTRIETETACIAKIELECGGKTLGPATGFFYKNNLGTYLITNWHVCSGRRPDSGKCIHHSDWPPDTLAVSFFNREFARVGLRIPLENNDGQSNWLQHTQWGQDVDIAAIPWNSPGKEYEPAASWDITTQKDQIFIRVGDDVFIIGFPMGLDKQNGMPVWKRGSIATEPNLNILDKKKVLVDSVTREGMSGSPVFLVKRGGFIDQNGTHRLATDCTELLGVYSGRYGKGQDDTVDFFDAQLGICWKFSYIEEIILGQTRGTYKIK
jgi:Trypsin-like peptidase domain